MQKRINIISKQILNDEGVVIQEGGILMRVSRPYADAAIKAGTHTPTSKGKLKSFLNKSSKINRNKRFLKKFDFSIGSGNEKNLTMYGSGKKYASVNAGQWGNKILVLMSYLTIKE